MTLKEALNIATNKLAKSIKSPRKESMILLCFFLDKDFTWVTINESINLQNHDKYFGLIQRRSEHEPIEYITEKVSFYSKDFFISKGVLIPRPETEILVDKTVEIIKKTGAKQIAEIGTGSGVVSIMLALFLKDIQIDATDISKEAIACAKINAKRFNVEDRITFYETSYLDGVKQPDVIVSNPPYIAKDEELERVVLNEPHSALFGGTIGDEMLKEIILLSLRLNVVGLACEMGYNQKNGIEKFFREKEIENYNFYQDLSGFDRGFTRS